MSTAATLAERRAPTDRRSSIDSGELTAAMAEAQIEVLFQPQFAAQDDCVVGAEALARWHHPAKGRTGIGPLFALAERSGRVRELSHHLIGRALAAAAEWTVPLRLSINVTAADLSSDTFADGLIDTVTAADFPLEHLMLEITEQALVTDLAGSAAQLSRLADQGVGIALDDFGAGFCNFHYLKRLPLDALKLDRSMIDGIDEDPRDLAVLRGIVAMARALDIAVCAEGIERDSQRAVIAREGCATWQGFLGAAPMNAPAFAAFAAGKEPLHLA